MMNPVSGTNDTDNTRTTIEQFFESRGWEYEIYETKKDENLRQRVMKAVNDGVDIVVAAGGDGTVSAVVGGMVNTQVPMGILPLGTGNALARGLNIPLALPDALALLGDSNQIFTMDVIQLGDDYYCLNVSIGVSAMTMRDTPRAEKRKFGMLAYLRRGIESLIKSRMHRFNLVVDQTKFQLAASELLIANDKLLGMQPLIDGVEINAGDGKLELFIVRAQSLRDYVGVVSHFILRRKSETAELNYLPIHESALIRSVRPLPVQADGEMIGETPVEVKLIPGALKVIVPAAKNGGK